MALPAIASDDRRACAGVAQRAARAAREVGVDIDAGHVSGRPGGVGQQRRVVARPGADLQHTIPGAHVE
jgi:hypothetical protein